VGPVDSRFGWKIWPCARWADEDGIWQFHSGDFAEVELDHSGYPVRMNGDEVRLLIDSDIDTWYAKSKWNQGTLAARNERLQAIAAV
jgi:hypothetical protein